MEELHDNPGTPRRSVGGADCQWQRVLAMAISLVVHLAVLLALLRPTPPTSLPAPTQTFASTGLQLELIDPIEAESAAVQPMFLASRKTTAATLVRSSARATATASAAPPRPLAASAHPPNTTASLLAGIATAAAAEANAVPKSRWSPAAQPLLLLPGRAQPFIAVPLPHRQRRSTQDVVVGMLRLIGGTMAAHPDAMGDQGTLIDPLRAQLGRLAHDHPDLDCSDPENPSLDPRCLQMH